jgi:RHS repeat-associated protein
VLRVFGANWAVERDYVYREGQLLAAHTNAPAPGDLLHYHNDHLGTPRFITRSDRVFQAYHAYYPFGEEATAFNQDTERMKFTGHERDLNSLAGPGDDLDYMHGRHYNPQLGRFLSTDPAKDSAKPSMPQSWNRYAYAEGNPLKYIDPDGQAVVAAVSFPDYEENAARRELIRSVLTATLGPGPALGADAALSMVLPSSPEEFKSNFSDSSMGLASSISLGGRVVQLGTNLAERFTSILKGITPFTRGQLTSFETRLAKEGVGSLLKSRASLQSRLVEHLSKIERVAQEGGYTSSLEREVRNFAQQINAIDDVLRTNGFILDVSSELAERSGG